MTSVYSAIVLGGGIAGAATAEALARRGQRVLLVEQFAPGHTRGSSHGDGRIIRYAYADPVYVELAQMAYPLWQEAGRRAGERLIHITGGWDCDVANSPQLAEMEANFRRYNLAYQRLTAQQSNRRWPQFHLPDGSEAIFQPDGGVAFADRAVRAFWRLAQAAGADVVTGERIVGLEVVAGRVTLHSETGRMYTGERLALTAGSWSGRLLQHLGLSLPLTPLQVQVAHFPVLSTMPHGVEAMPVFIDYHTPQPFYGLPQIERPGVKVGWHTAGQPLTDPDEEHPLNAADLAVLCRFVGQRLPHLGTTPLQTILCRYTLTPDEHFVIDRHPELPQVVIGTGFSGHGFKFGPALGELITRLLLQERVDFDLTRFALSRFERTPGRLAR